MEDIAQGPLGGAAAIILIGILIAAVVLLPLKGLGWVQDRSYRFRKERQYRAVARRMLGQPPFAVSTHAASVNRKTVVVERDGHPTYEGDTQDTLPFNLYLTDGVITRVTLYRTPADGGGLGVDVRLAEEPRR